MTNGPLTPPMVLYRMRGVTEIMRGSTTSGMVAVVSGLEAQYRSVISRGPQSIRSLEDGWVMKLEVEPSKWVGEL